MIDVEQLKRMHPSVGQGFTDPITLLARCHEKIGAQLDALERAAEVLREGPSGRRLSAFFAIDMARAHFNGPVVKHTEDEELSLFPRLRLARTGAAGEALAAVGELETEHRLADKLQQDFERIVDSLPRCGDPDVEAVGRLGETVTVLCALYRRHMRVEDEIVFPAAARALTAGDLGQITEEMRARRRLVLRRL